jgi:NADPH2:quinone reductase
MVAVVTDPAGGPELRPQRVAVPEPGPGQRRLRLSLIGVNFIDILRRGDHYPAPPGTVLGWEAVGRADDGGRYVVVDDELQGYAQYAIVAESKLQPISDDVDDELAMHLFQSLTAEYLATSAHPVHAGETVVVFAAAGGVGQLLVQISRHLGARVIGVVSRSEKAASVAELGAEPVVTTGTDLDAIRRVVPNGADVIFDANGNSTWELTLASAKRRGHIVLFGGMGPPQIDPSVLRQHGSLTLSYTSVFDYIGDPAERAQRVEHVLEMFGSGAIRRIPITRFPLERAAEAHALMQSRASVGKIVLSPT